MDGNQTDLVMSFALRKISEETFRQNFSGDLRDPVAYVGTELEKILAQKGTGLELECVLILGFMLQCFRANHCDCLCQLLLEPWHKQHENIAAALWELAYPESVDSLYRAASLELTYLAYDEFKSLGVKCVYALHAIGTKEAKEKLKLLAQSTNPFLAEAARRGIGPMP